MKIDILSLFPEMFQGFLSSSLLGKAIQKKIVEIHITNFRQFASSKHQTVDDTPYGGGGGMVLKPEPIFEAVETLKQNFRKERRLEIEDLHASENKVVLLCPQGETFTHKKAIQFSTCKHLIFICGHYEGFDERIREYLVTDEISIGDYVLMGGEVPAMVITESIVRLLPGVLGNQLSSLQDSFSDGLLEHPQYTKPSVFRNWEVPQVLLSGNHEHIKQWRKEQSLLRTYSRRPDLIEQYPLTIDERDWLEKMILSSKNNFIDK